MESLTRKRNTKNVVLKFEFIKDETNSFFEFSNFNKIY
jgi:hypothetical protein